MKIAFLFTCFSALQKTGSWVRARNKATYYSSQYLNLYVAVYKRVTCTILCHCYKSVNEIKPILQYFKTTHKTISALVIDDKAWFHCSIHILSTEILHFLEKLQSINYTFNSQYKLILIMSNNTSYQLFYLRHIFECQNSTTSIIF